MSEFDDPQLEQALGRLSGAFPDDNVALGALHQRVQQVRRRRTIVASSAASLLLVVGVGVAAARSAQHGTLQPGASISIDDTTTQSTGTTEAHTSVVTATTEPATTRPAPRPTTTMPVVPVSTPPPINGGSQGGGNGGSHTTVVPTTAHTTTSMAPVTTATPTTAPSGYHTYSTPGGWVTVRFANGRLELIASHAAPGFHVDSRTVEPTRIEFRFRGDGGDYRIRVEVKDGSLQVTG